jgi:hypothetical protein
MGPLRWLIVDGGPPNSARAYCGRTDSNGIATFIAEVSHAHILGENALSSDSTKSSSAFKFGRW